MKTNNYVLIAILLLAGCVDQKHDGPATRTVKTDAGASAEKKEQAKFIVDCIAAAANGRDDRNMDRVVVRCYEIGHNIYSSKRRRRR